MDIQAGSVHRRLRTVTRPPPRAARPLSSVLVAPRRWREFLVSMDKCDGASTAHDWAASC